MIKKFLILFIFLIFSSTSSIAVVDVVYPTSKNTVINASNTFVFGNISNGNSLLINDKPAKIHNGNFFVEIVNLDYGKNEIVFTETDGSSKNDVIYYITRNKPSSSAVALKVTLEEFNKDEIYYTKTIKNNATVREAPTTASNRAVELPENVVLYVDGKQGDYYRIKTNSYVKLWIHKTNIEQPVVISQQMNNIIKHHKFIEDEDYEYHKFNLTYPVLYTVKQSDNELKLTLYGVKNKAHKAFSEENFEYTFEINHPVVGYECYYEDNKFVLKIAKVPQPKGNEVLTGVKIFVDAGHGGVEKGAVGPTRVNEKDINLSIANKLVEILKNNGAIVSYSRCDDRQVGLYERVNMAKDNNALISVSIHNNSLPNGKSPYIQHGTEVHYYNDNAKMLAHLININLVRDLNLKNNGIHRTSLALNRSTNPVSVLVEIAYMINPEEYVLLMNPNFRDKAALSISNSIKQYVSLIREENKIVE